MSVRSSTTILVQLIGENYLNDLSLAADALTGALKLTRRWRQREGAGETQQLEHVDAVRARSLTLVR